MQQIFSGARNALLLLTALTCLTTQQATAQVTPPSIRQPAVSPDGSYLALEMYLGDTGERLVSVYNLAAPTDPPFDLYLEAAQRVNWIRWVSADRLLASIQIGDGVFFGLQTRLIAVDLANRLAHEVVVTTTDGGIVQLSDDLIDLLPNDPDHVLLRRVDVDTRRTDIVRASIIEPTSAAVNLSRRRSSTASRLGERQAPGLEILDLGDRPPGATLTWLMDSMQRVRVAEALDGTVIRVFSRQDGSGPWTEMHSRSVDDRSILKPLIFDTEDPDLIVAAARRDDRIGLYRIGLSSGEVVETIFSPDGPPELFDVIFDPTGKAVDAVRYGSAPNEIHWVDSRGSATLEAAREGLSLEDLRIVSRNNDFDVVVLSHESADYPATFYLQDTSAARITILGEERPGVAAATKTRRVYPEGGDSDFYLSVTIPQTVEDLTSAALPHVLYLTRTRENVDLGHFDPVVPAFTRNGLAVARLSHSVNSNYDDLEEVPFPVRNPEPVEQIVDAARWLRTADTATGTCLVVKSFTAYHAFLATIEDPSLFDCMVVSDPIIDIRQLESFTVRRYLYSEAALLALDAVTGDRLSLGEIAERATVPLLLVRFESVRTIAADHFRALRSALRRSAAPVEVLEIPDSEDPAEAEELYFEAVAAFIARHAGGDATANMTE